MSKRPLGPHEDSVLDTKRAKVDLRYSTEMDALIRDIRENSGNGFPDRVVQLFLDIQNKRSYGAWKRDLSLTHSGLMLGSIHNGALYVQMYWKFLYSVLHYHVTGFVDSSYEDATTLCEELLRYDLSETPRDGDSFILIHTGSSRETQFSRMEQLTRYWANPCRYDLIVQGGVECVVDMRAISGSRLRVQMTANRAAADAPRLAHFIHPRRATFRRPGSRSQSHAI